MLDENNAAAKKIKCTFFAKEIESLNFQLSKGGTVPVERKIDKIAQMKQPENITEVRSLIGSMNHFFLFNSNSAATTERFRDPKKKHSRFEWRDAHSRTFAEMK